MVFDSLLELIGDDPVFESSTLLAGNIDPRIVRLQLSRWVKSGRIYQLRRGLYAVAPPYQKIQPHSFLIANHLQRASYVSMQSALAYYDMIPEVLKITVSVTTGRPERLETPLGIFEFRHIKSGLLFGYKMIDLGGQSALVATPEKALLDLVYFLPGAVSMDFLRELRLQNTDKLNLDLLLKQAELFGTLKMLAAAQDISQLIHGAESDYEEL